MHEELNRHRSTALVMTLSFFFLRSNWEVPSASIAIVRLNLNIWTTQFAIRDGTISDINPLRPNSDLSQTSHCNIMGLSVSEVMGIENMITHVKFY